MYHPVPVPPAPLRITSPTAASSQPSPPAAPPTMPSTLPRSSLRLLPHTTPAHSAPPQTPLGRGVTPPSRASGPLPHPPPGRHPRPPSSTGRFHQSLMSRLLARLPAARAVIPSLPRRCPAWASAPYPASPFTRLHPFTRLRLRIRRSFPPPPTFFLWDDHQLACPR